MHIITIQFKPQGELSLPLARFTRLQGLVYNLLSFDSAYGTSLHGKKEADGDDAIKLFSFSDIKGHYTFYDNRLHFRDNFLFEIRCADPRAADIIAARLDSDSECRIGSCPCTAVNYQRSDAPLFAGSEAHYKMNTPITVYNTKEGYRKYYTPYDGEFYVGVEKNLLKKYERVYGKPYEGDLEFSCIRFSKRDKCVTKYKNTMVTAYYGVYRLIADADMQRVAYLCGLGSKNSMGFGLPDLMPR